MPSLQGGISNYFWEGAATKIPEKIKSVGFVSGARQCHEHKMSATTNNLFFVKKEWPKKARNFWLLSFEPGPNPNIIYAARARSVQTSTSMCRYRICACVGRTFFDKNSPSKIGVRQKTRNIMSFWRLSPPRRYCMLWNSQQIPLVFETVILQDIAHARRRQRITGASAYFDYLRVAWHYQFWEVGRPWHHWQLLLLATTKVPRMQSQIFYFHTGKI
jgi:hypothetical protein